MIEELTMTIVGRKGKEDREHGDLGGRIWKSRSAAAASFNLIDGRSGTSAIRMN
jgi:hypothetical protein